MNEMWRIFSAVYALVAAVSSCQQSEFNCGNGKCVPLNRVCNGLDDCGDSSDETRQCSPCNKTYYGNVGKTYELELHRPKEDKVPYICKLSFNAPGGDLGDIVQLTFDSFTLGRFVSFTAEGCPDGSLQIAEAQRPDVGGLWCGTSWGPAIYYSETSSVSLTLRLLRLSKDQTGYNFDFRMEYKMIRKSDAVVRYGNPFVGMTQVTTSPSTTVYQTVTDLDNSSISVSGHTGELPVHTVQPTRSTSSEQYLGDLISGTYCSRIFSDCDRKKCRLQSPNFPGLYPRNLTCYYAVRQHEVPPGKHALISVRQSRGQLVAVRARPATQAEPPPRELRLWQDCDVVQDYVTVYDGYTTRDPVILKFCGGGEPVPEAISSGPELLVEFTTSPFGTFLHPTPVHSLHGFQLEVQVKFVDINSPTYSRNKRCEFWLQGNGGGLLASPRHTLPRNSTCLYHLQGMGPAQPSPTPPRPLPKFPEQRPGTVWRKPAPRLPEPQFRVWLSVLKFHVGSTINPAVTEEECATTLMIWDGQMRPMTECNDILCVTCTVQRSEKNEPRVSPTPSLFTLLRSGQRSVDSGGSTRLILQRALHPGVESVYSYCSHSENERQRGFERTGDPIQAVAARPAGNTSLLARYCKDRVPRTCDHAIFQNSSRPCSLGESFISSGSTLTIEMRMIESTALRPVNFRALYEFVDLHQDGDTYGSGPCSRVFYSRNRDHYADKKFQSPRDIFLYGRGGSKNLSCVYRFEGEHDEVVKLRFNKLVNGNRSCRSVSSPDFNRLLCVGSNSFSLKVYEFNWASSPPIQRDCLCSNRSLPINVVSTSSVVEVHFTVRSMDALDDYNNLHFEGVWDFVKAVPCLRKQRVKGPSGEIKFWTPLDEEEEKNCVNHPWLIDPGPDQYLYVKMPGTIVTNETNCATRNRVVVHTGGEIHVAVCPKPPTDFRHHVVEVFSDGWAVSSNAMILAPGSDPARSIAVEFIGDEIDSYSVTWLELSRRPSVTTPAAGLQRPRDCEQRCPELDACINASLWCDGVSHCPSGYDEALTHCSMLLRLPPLHLGLGLLSVISILGVLVFVTWRICRQKRNRSISQHRLKSISSETAIIDGKEVIC